MEELYIRVGTTIYKVVQQPLVDGTTITRRIQWSFGTIRQDYGKNNIPSITKYNGFCTVPSHINYQKEVAGFYNLYEPITHIPVEGDFKHIRSLVEHIFTDSMAGGAAALSSLCSPVVSDRSDNRVDAEDETDNTHAGDNGNDSMAISP